ncbi:MAG: 50S ribosomal protein L11 methyltransferase [Pseudomonadota bacterium]
MFEYWVTVRISVSNCAADSVASFLSDIGSRGCLTEDTDTKASDITAYFPNLEWNLLEKKLFDFLENLEIFFPGIPKPKVFTEPLKSENWAVAWQDRFKRLKIGSKLIIAPPWDLPKKSTQRLVVVIEPAEAFGTGTHETTQSCLVLLEQAIDHLVAAEKPFSFLDVGCGSGILALAAARLGAKIVKAIDCDSVAVSSAVKNAVLNRLENSIAIEVLDLGKVSGSYDLVAANLDFMTLMGNLEKLAGLFTKGFILSGITKDQWTSLILNLAEMDLTCIREIKRNEWATGLFIHG